MGRFGLWRRLIPSRLYWSDGEPSIHQLKHELSAHALCANDSDLIQGCIHHAAEDIALADQCYGRLAGVGSVIARLYLFVDCEERKSAEEVLDKFSVEWQGRSAGWKFENAQAIYACMLASALLSDVGRFELWKNRLIDVQLQSVELEGPEAALVRNLFTPEKFRADLSGLVGPGEANRWFARWDKGIGSLIDSADE